MPLRLSKGPVVLEEAGRGEGRDPGCYGWVPGSWGAIFAGDWKLLKFLKQTDGIKLAF